MKEQNEGMARPSWNSLLSDEKPSKTFHLHLQGSSFLTGQNRSFMDSDFTAEPNSHSFGNNTHSVENKDFFSSKTI